MKEIIGSNYGLRAYTEVQEIKQTLLNDNDSKNTSTALNSTKYIFNNTYTNFNKNISVNYKNTCGYVKIWYDCDKNYSNYKIIIKQNSVTVYNGAFNNYIEIGVKYFNTNTFSFDIACSEKDLNFAIEFLGQNSINECKQILLKSGSNYYKICNAYDETIVYSYASLGDAINHNNYTKYNLQLRLLDAKNTSCFGGETLYIWGVNSSNKVVYYSSSNSFASSAEIFSYTDDNIVGLYSSNSLMTYFLEDNVVKCKSIYSDNTSSITTLQCVSDKKYIAIVSSCAVNIGTSIYQCLVTKDSSGRYYLIVFETSQSTYANSFVIYIGSNADYSIDSSNGVIKLFATSNCKTKIKNITINTSEHTYAIADTSTIEPCTYCSVLGDKYIVQYSNCLTAIAL